jgi:hypothetical protein
MSRLKEVQQLEQEVFQELDELLYRERLLENAKQNERYAIRNYGNRYTKHPSRARVDNYYYRKEQRERLRRYKNNAKTRSLSWKLDDQFAVELMDKECFYCGAEATPMNGIDRIDSSDDYLIPNVVPCCQICNRAKSDLPFHTFMEWIDKLVKNRSTYVKQYPLGNWCLRQYMSHLLCVSLTAPQVPAWIAGEDEEVRSWRILVALHRSVCRWWIEGAWGIGYQPGFCAHSRGLSGPSRRAYLIQ